MCWVDKGGASLKAVFSCQMAAFSLASARVAPFDFTHDAMDGRSRASRKLVQGPSISSGLRQS